MSAFIEKWWPFGISVSLCVLVVLNKGQYFDLDSIVTTLKTNTVSICITLLGFFLTILTIIQALDNAAVRYIKTIGVMGRLYLYLKRAIQFNAIATLWVLVVGVINLGTLNENLNLCSSILLMFFVFMALTTSVRFIYIFLSIIKSED